MYMCHRINKIRRENFCKHGSHGRRARSVVHFSISFAVLAKIDHELFVLFVFTKVPAKTKSVACFARLKVIVFSFSFSEPTRYSSTPYCPSFSSTTELVPDPLEQQST